MGYSLLKWIHRYGKWLFLFLTSFVCFINFQFISDFAKTDEVMLTKKNQKFLSLSCRFHVLNWDISRTFFPRRKCTKIFFVVNLVCNMFLTNTRSVQKKR